MSAALRPVPVSRFGPDVTLSDALAHLEDLRDALCRAGGTIEADLYWACAEDRAKRGPLAGDPLEEPSAAVQAQIDRRDVYAQVDARLAALVIDIAQMIERGFE